MKDALQASGVSSSLRAVSAASIAAAAVVTATHRLSGPEPHRLTFVVIVGALACLVIVGHALAESATSAIPKRISPQLYRSVVGALSAAVAIYLMTLSSRLSGNRSIALALLGAAGIQAFACTRATDLVLNGLLGAGVVGVTIAAGNTDFLGAVAGLLWTGLFGAQLMLAHRHELATKIVHSAKIEPEQLRISHEPWSRTLLGSLAALLLLVLIASALLAIKSALQFEDVGKGGREGAQLSPVPGRDSASPSSGGSGGASSQNPSRPSASTNSGDERPEGRAPGVSGGESRGGSSTSRSSEPNDRTGLRPSEYPITGLDLARTEPSGEPGIFAVVKAEDSRPIRAHVFTIYRGDAFLAPTPQAWGQLHDCPCTLPTSRDSSAPFEKYDQLIEIVTAYEGPLPAAFEARRVWFRTDAGVPIDFVEGGSLIPRGAVKTGFSYRVESEVPLPDRHALLASEGSVPPEVAAQGLQLPDGYSKRVRDLAAKITDGKRTQYAKAQAITEYVLKKHRFLETTLDRDRSKDAVEEYLFERRFEGTGDDAVVAAVVMMRTVGVPARVGFGYRPVPLENSSRSATPSEPPSTRASASPPTAQSPPSSTRALGSESRESENNLVYALDRAQRTTWVEVYVSGFGWVTEDIQPLLRADASSESRYRNLAGLALVLLVAAAAIASLLLFAKSRKKKVAAGEGEAFGLMRMLEQAVGIDRLPTQTPSEYGAVLWARLPNADRELAMYVVTAIVQLSYTKNHLSETERVRVHQALERLVSMRQQRERRLRHAGNHRRRGA